MLTVRQLQSPTELTQAQKLLYQCYIAEMNWKFSPTNPSGLRVETNAAGESLLRDNLEFSARQVGVFDNDHLVGTLRVLRPVEQSLEVELYHTLPPQLQHGSLKLLEINRMAVLSQYQQSRVPVMLINELVKVMLADEVDMLVTAVSEPEPAGLCRKLGFTPAEQKMFRYLESDPYPVRLYQLDCRVSGTLERIVNMCEHLLAA